MGTRKRRPVGRKPSHKTARFSPRANLRAFLARNNVSFEFLGKKATMHAGEASRVTGIPLKSFAKTIIFVNEFGKPFAAVLRADLQVNRHDLQRLTGFKSVKIAPVEVSEKAAGFPIGGIPPIGHRMKMPTFIDRTLLNLEAVWCGGGSRSKLVKLQVSDILRLNKGKVASFSVSAKKRLNKQG